MMKSHKNVRKSMFWGAISGVNACVTLERTLDLANTKAAVLEAKLAVAPEITESVYVAAQEVAWKLTYGDSFGAIVYAGLTGIGASLAIYYATRKD